MEVVNEIIDQIKVPTSNFSNATMQAVLIKLQKLRNTYKKNENWNIMSDMLWTHLQNNFECLDDQLLCATCLYTVIGLSELQDQYLQNILETLQQDLERKEQNRMAILISLVYGLFQSNFLKNVYDSSSKIEPVLKQTFNILTTLAYDYAWYTFLVFKTIDSLKKIVNTRFAQIIFTEDNKIKLLNLVNHNWENPITGVRDFNKTIFKTLISMMDNHRRRRIIDELNSNFAWNKAKYLMLAEIIAQDHKPLTSSVNVPGLIKSLHKPELVSPGTDMYISVLKRVKSAEEWCEIFLYYTVAHLHACSCCHGSEPPYKHIDNFSNYWCLTTFKKFPTVMNTILQELNKEMHPEHNLNTNVMLYSTLSVMKQGNKLGLLKKDWERNMSVCVEELEHRSAHVRMLAFDIVCVSQERTLPSRTEYDLVYSYLKNNTNCDSTILRISMLGSLKSFLTRINSAFHINMLSTANITIDEDLRRFFQQIQEFIVESINLRGNYQRKITTINIFDEIITTFSETPKRKGQKIVSPNETLLEVLKEKGFWSLSNETLLTSLMKLLEDQEQDVKEKVAKVLLKHYCTELMKSDRFNSMIEYALRRLRSKFFYEINSGRNIFKLIVNVLIEGNVDGGDFKTVEEVFLFACNELKAEYTSKRDIMESITAGRQLHSFIAILYSVLEECHQKSHELRINNSVISELLEILKGISTQFAWDEEPWTSSDFSKMSDMVQNIIQRSSFNPCNENDHTKISGLQQLVLNSMWLNVKACCELGSMIIKSQTEDSSTDLSTNCLSIITNVLETSRHKGVIEAAGASLGECIKHLTSLPKNTGLSKLPDTLLRVKLNDLMSEAGNMASVTRRGAGLSIMVHRIVASDMKKGKPLLHHFMKILLETCNTTEDVPVVYLKGHDIDNEKDLPKAIYIHFLTRIVTDSSLSSEMMHYSASLARLAFSNLTSKCWQIRNAALQLYGALAPKFIGQKKTSSIDEETVANVASDEFRTHFPELWKYILHRLRNIDNVDTVQAHSDLIPLLNLLANTARRYSFSYDRKKQRQEYEELLDGLWPLLGSPIHTVRRLAAKSICNNFSLRRGYESIAKQHTEGMTENMLHGCLMATAIYRKYYSYLHMEEFYNLKEILYERLYKGNGKHSFICRRLYEDRNMFYTTNWKKTLEDILLELSQNNAEPGIHEYINLHVEEYVRHVDYNDIPQILETLLAQTHYEQYCVFFHKRLTTESEIPPDVRQRVSKSLLKFEKKFDSGFIWKFLYDLRLSINVSNEDLAEILNFVERNDFIVPYKIRYLIPFVSTFIHSFPENDDSVINFANMICSLTNSEYEMRNIAALANNEFGSTFCNLTAKVKIIAIKSTVILLQDEDEDIRNACVDFYRNISKSTPPHPFICLSRLLDYTFLRSSLPENLLSYFCEDLVESLRAYTKNTEDFDEHNPFANDSKNMYMEVKVIYKLIDKISCAIKQK